MKLRSTARALLTLGPKLAKDKLMQGAGRMRRLGRGQTLVLVATAEVSGAIASMSGCSPIEVRHVLNWVMRNTVTATIEGLLMWAHHGLSFSSTLLDDGKAFVDEDWTLGSLYASKHVSDLLSNVIRTKIGHSQLREAPLAKAIMHR